MRAAYGVYLERHPDLMLPPMTIDYRDEIRNHPTWVATAGSKLVGGLTMVFGDNDASIANVAVHPEFQGQGLGAGLMRFAEDEARRRGHTALSLATHVRLTGNVAYYRRLGWHETGRDAERVFMNKPL